MAETSLKTAADAAGGQGAPSTLAFDRFTLDLARAELRRDGVPVPLRPKAFDLLATLAAQPGRVLAKEQLMQAVWPGVIVTDDSLTQCVHELRQALGDRAALVRTVPRRGYRLDAELAPDVAVPAVAAPAAASDGPSRRPRRWAIVAAFVLVGVAALAWQLGVVATAWHTPQDLARTPLPRQLPPLSIIVMPLEVEGAEPADEWLAEALHGDLVMALSRLPESLVIARDTAATYKGRAVDSRQVAREMGVRHVVRGKLRQQGRRIGLGFSLVDGETGVQRWSGSFDSDRAELAQAVGDFAVAVERTLAVEMYRSGAERAAALSPAQVSADDLAMQGFARWYRGVTRENVLAARALFERALELNPDSWRAWAGIQFTTANQLMNGWTDDRAAELRRHNEAVASLERVDRDGSQTYSGKTFMLFAKRDFAAMLRTTTEWTERHQLPLAYGGHGAALLFNARFDEAVPVLERALRMGPRDAFRAEWQYRLALAHWAAGRYELARDWSRNAADTTPTLVWPPIHAAAMHRLGQAEAARQAMAEFRQRHPGFATSQLANRMPGTDPAYVEMRERLIESLRALGMP